MLKDIFARNDNLDWQLSNSSVYNVSSIVLLQMFLNFILIKNIIISFSLSPSSFQPPLWLLPLTPILSLPLKLITSFPVIII